MDKQSKLNQIRARLAQTTDRLGAPIDEGIMETVVYLNALNFPTLQSCEGHFESGRPYPWILIGADNEPEERYVGQLEIFQKTADQYQIPLEEVIRGRHEQAYSQAFMEASEHPERADYQAWRAENHQLRKRMTALLDQFYLNRTVTTKAKLSIFALGGGEFFLQPNISLQEDFLLDQMSPEEQQAVHQNLATYQAEMANFTLFLRQQYEE